MQTKFLHEFVYNDLKSKILDGTHPTGASLPREIDLTASYQVSRHTIRKALERLHHEGFIRKVKGTGTFVSYNKSDYNLFNMNSFTELIRSQNGEPNSVILSISLDVPAQGIAEKMKLEEGAKVFILKRIRKNKSVPLCYEVTYINPELCPGISGRVTATTSLYELYEKEYKLELNKGFFQFEAVNSSGSIAQLLGIAAGSALLYMEALVSITTGTPLYFVEAHYIGSRYIFSTFMKRLAID